MKTIKVYLSEGHNKDRFIIAIGTITTIFIIDLLIPLGIPIGALYPLVIIFTKHSPVKKIKFYGLLSIVFVIVKFLVVFNGVIEVQYIFSRIFTICAIVGSTILILKIKNIEGKAILDKKQYIQSLEEMMFITSHKVRVPVANCLGLLDVFKQSELSKEEIDLMFNYMSNSAKELERFTRELTDFIHKSGIEHRVNLNKNGEK